MNKLFLLSSFFLLQCISIRVYVPPQFTQDFGNLQNPIAPASTVILEQEKTDFFATSSFWFFGTSKHKNHYGSLEELINKELKENANLYQSLLPLNIKITKFELSSRDKCIKNIAEVALEIKTFDKKGVLIQDFKYNDNIDSMVSTCTNIWVSLPLFVGWIWYGPYIGFRGNQEDQMNQLGRIAIMSYFNELQKINSKGVTK